MDMEQNDTDWGGGTEWSMSEQGDMDVSNKNDESVNCDKNGSNMEVDEEYMSNLGLYDGYDSFNEMSGSSEEGEGETPSGYDNYSSDSKSNSGFRFINGKDGMATCERCGSVGIKHAFYSKSKRFCSLSCSRSYATAQREGKPSPTEFKGNGPQKKMPGKKMNSSKKLQMSSPVKANPTPKTIMPGGVRGFDWGPYLASSCSNSAPVTSFKHCPMAEVWQNISVGMKVEVINHEWDLDTNAYWIATVVKIAGYKGLMRFEGYGYDPSHDFWINICVEDVHPVGWCATSGNPLVPPKGIQHKYLDWKEYLIKRLTGARTLPSNFYSKVVECINNHKFVPGVKVEVVDKMCVSAMRVAKVEEVIGGRLRLNYVDSKEENDDFWCHYGSALVHPIGWSQQTGHKLHATTEYRNKCLNKITMGKYDESDAVPDMFPKKKEPSGDCKFQVGMKLEAIDPLNLSAICVATVTKVLKKNYIMIGIDGSMAQNGSDWFCYHVSSPCIFPVGFCEINALQLTPPRGYKGQFKWFEYLKATKSVAASVKLFDKEIPKHGFKPGMKLEAVDLMEPRLVCVATVSQVIGRLLRIHFDGWEIEYDQWVDCESPDIYPVGWCEILNFQLEGPRLKVEVSPQNSIPKPAAKEPGPKKRKGKTQIFKGPRKKRKPRYITGTPVLREPLHNNRDQGFMSYGSRTRPLLCHSVPALIPKSEDCDLKNDFQIKVKQERHKKEQESGDYSNADGPPVLSPHGPLPSMTSTPVIKTSSDPDSLKMTLSFKREPVDNDMALQHSTSNISPKSTKSALTSLLQTKPTPSHSLLLDNEQLTERQNNTPPLEWTTQDVVFFFKSQDCAQHVDSFSKMNIDGKKLLELTKEDIVNLTGMKVGASLKVFELIQNLKNSNTT